MSIEWLLHYAKFNACWDALYQVEELFLACRQCIAYYLICLIPVAGLTYFVCIAATNEGDTRCEEQA